MLNDKDAIQQLKGGDVHGLESLVEKYQVTAIRAAYLIVQDEEAAKDIAADAFVRAYEKIASFDSERPFGPWLYAIVTNLARRAASKQNRTLSLAVEHLEYDTNYILNPAEQAEQVEQQEILWAAISRLKANQRAMLVQRYYLEMSVKEIANAQGLPEGTVKWQLNRARQQLKKILPAQI